MCAGNVRKQHGSVGSCSTKLIGGETINLSQRGGSSVSDNKEEGILHFLVFSIKRQTCNVPAC